MERTPPEALVQELLQWHGQLQALLAPARWGSVELNLMVPATAVSAAQFYFSTDNHELRNHQLYWPCR
jgi:hypothetical protein